MTRTDFLRGFRIVAFGIGGLVLFMAGTVSCSAERTALLRVSRVFDGDTLLLSNGEKVRLIGIDCPEAHDSDKLRRIIRETGLSEDQIKSQGREAERFTRGLALDKDVLVEFDQELRDKYGRLLAYVWVFYDDEFFETSTEPDFFVTKRKKGYNGQFVFLNAAVIKAGFAEPLSIPPNTRYARQFRRYFQEAHQQQRGLWSRY